MYKPKPLDYSYNSLEPYIDSDTLNTHYNKYYLNYLNNLNALLNSLNYDYRYSKEELLNHIDIFPVDKRDDIVYFLGGVLNHELYFDSLGPNNEPNFQVLNKINEDFGSYENFKQEFIKNAKLLVGSGYTSLVVDKNNKLRIINTSNQDTPLLYGFKPILNIDLWEHAYFLKYRNRKDMYIDSFFQTIDFNKLNNRYENI